MAVNRSVELFVGNSMVAVTRSAELFSGNSTAAVTRSAECLLSGDAALAPVQHSQQRARADRALHQDMGLGAEEGTTHCRAAGGV